MIVAEFSIFPVDKGESLSPYVARITKIVAASGLPYRLHAMGTNVEGEYHQITTLIGQCLEELKKDCNRISISVKMDYRKKPGGRIKSKVQKVEQLSGIKRIGNYE